MALASRSEGSFFYPTPAGDLPVVVEAGGYPHAARAAVDGHRDVGLAPERQAGALDVQLLRLEHLCDWATFQLNLKTTKRKNRHSEDH